MTPDTGIAKTSTNFTHSVDVPLPVDFVELPKMLTTSIEHRLGYFGNERFVIFGYCPGGGEVVWKDGLSYGFGAGGWQIFLYEIAPLAARHGAVLGSLQSTGTHVLVMDRLRARTFAAPRERAEAFMARVCAQPPPSQPCLCAITECARCRVLTCVLHPSPRAPRRADMDETLHRKPPAHEHDRRSSGSLAAVSDGSPCDPPPDGLAVRLRTDFRPGVRGSGVVESHVK